MALLGPKIWENLVLSTETKINEHGTVEIAIGSQVDTNSMLAALGGEEEFSVGKQSFREYAPTVENSYDKSVNDVPTILKQLLALRFKYLQFMKLYATEEEAKAAIWEQKMFEGLGIPPEEMGKAIEMLNNQAFLTKVTTNLNNIFMNFMNAKNAFTNPVPFRIKLVRSSETNHYSRIPKTQFETWIEPMTVPKEQSKIAWTQYDLDNKLNDGTPVATDKDKKGNDKKSNEKKAKLTFGTKAAEGQVAEQAPLKPKQPSLIGGN